MYGNIPSLIDTLTVGQSNPYKGRLKTRIFCNLYDASNRSETIALVSQNSCHAMLGNCT